MLAFGIVSANAQLTVYNNGNVNVGSTQQSSNVTLSVGDVAYNDTAYYVSLSLCNAATGGYNIGGGGHCLQLYRQKLWSLVRVARRGWQLHQ